MALLSTEEESARARAGWAFSNGSEYEAWSSIWCTECTHLPDCPLLIVILDEKTPAAWEDENPGALNRYYCHEFEARNDQTQALP